MPYAKKLCSIDGCGNVCHAKGWCSTHHRRWKLTGDPLKTVNRPPGSGFFANGYKAEQIGGVKKFEHVRIAEQVLGKPLPPGAVVHHANGDRSDNRKENLVICPSRAYHNFLHQRLDAMNACGNPNWRKCRHCKQYDDPANLRIYQPKGVNTTHSWHMQCARDAEKRRTSRVNR